MEFDWHDAKAESNLRRHGISFYLATTAFDDPLAIEALDDREGYGEDRFIMMGLSRTGTLLFVVYTVREETIWIISARRATRLEQEDYFR